MTDAGSRESLSSWSSGSTSGDRASSILHRLVDSRGRTVVQRNAPHDRSNQVEIYYSPPGNSLGMEGSGGV